MQLVQAIREHLASYVAALHSGWSSDTSRPDAAKEELERIEADADRFLASLYDPEAEGDPITLPDGSTVARLPGFIKWMWDGDLRLDWAALGKWHRSTTAALSRSHRILGRALETTAWLCDAGTQTVAPEAKTVGLRFVQITTDVDNVISQCIVTTAGGVLMERFTKLPQNGGGEGFRFRIDL